jgi:uncharacterized protein YecT (DUF1311 family)
MMDDRSYADLRREYEAQHRALVEAQRAWIETGELRDKAEAEIERLRAALEKIRDRASGNTAAEAEANAGIFAIADNALK